MSCQHHPTGGHTTERNRPPDERDVREQQAAAIHEQLTAAHEAILAAVAGTGAVAISLSSLALVRRAISLRFSRYDDAIADAFRETAYGGAERGRETTVRRFDLDTEPTFSRTDGGPLPERDPFDATRRDLDRGARRDWNLVKGRMADDIAGSIVDANDAGMSREEIADRLRFKLPSAGSYEAERIADAELSMGIGRGQLSAFQDSSNDSKRWGTQLDSRVRVSHRAMEGVRVPLGEPFVVGPSQSPARYPGDWRLPPRERLGCRCFLTI
jgi:uncharacterized protein with gpF-like domain